MNKVNLRKSAIKEVGNFQYVDIDQLKTYEVLHRFTMRHINWEHILMLVDMQAKNKTYATLVIEEGMDFYLVPETTTTIINSCLRNEDHFSACYNRGIAETVGARNKYPLITSFASLAPLPNHKRSRTSSWFNADILGYCQIPQYPKNVFLQCYGDDTLLKTSASAFYMHHKMEDVRRMAGYIIEDSRRYQNTAHRLARYVNSHPQMAGTDYVTVGKDTIQSVRELTAKYMYDKLFPTSDDEWFEWQMKRDYPSNN